MRQENRSPFQTRDENEDEVRSLADLIEVRQNPTEDDMEVGEIQGDDEDLDIEDALTFPHKKRAPREVTPDDITDFDGDARTSSPADDEDDASYMTRADVEASMLETDPDPNTGIHDEDLLGGGNLGRAPDITGTVTGAAPGLGTHLPIDLGAGGFQIEEPEALGDPRVTDADDDTDAGLDPSLKGDNDFMDEDESLLEDDLASDGGQIPVAKPNINTRDEALDATRQIQ